MNTLRAAALFVIALTPAAQAQTQRPKPAAAPVPPLQTANPLISQFEDGPPLPVGQKLIPGDTAFFRFEAAGFKTGDEGKVQVTAGVEEVAIATTLRQEDKDWKPILRSQFQVPGLAPPGVYKIKYSLIDKQTDQKTAAETTFEVAGREIPRSDKLIVHGIAFYRNAEDEKPLGVAAYRPGDSVWVKFDVTGYKYGEQNAIDVAYDVAVNAPDGKQLFAQEDAAVEKSQAFYPQPWIPGSFSITLQPNMKPGTYSISVTARDAMGKQTVTEKAEFKVE